MQDYQNFVTLVTSFCQYKGLPKTNSNCFVDLKVYLERCQTSLPDFLCKYSEL